MDAFDTQILLGPDHVKAKKSELCVHIEFFFFQLFILTESEFKKDNF